jgi:hypothetical protein
MTLDPHLTVDALEEIRSDIFDLLEQASNILAESLSEREFARADNTWIECIERALSIIESESYSEYTFKDSIAAVWHRACTEKPNE